MEVKPLAVTWKGSPNYWRGRRGYTPHAIVIHIMDGTLVGTDAWFSKRYSFVSAHYGIGVRGQIHQYVDTKNTAWHAGTVRNPSWSGIIKGVNPNLYTIGIEHEGGPNDIWSDAMKRASAKLIVELSQKYGIRIDRQHVIGHYEIHAGKPNCPAGNKDIIDELVSMARDLQLNIPRAKSNTPILHLYRADTGRIFIKKDLYYPIANEETFKLIFGEDGFRTAEWGQGPTPPTNEIGKTLLLK